MRHTVLLIVLLLTGCSTVFHGSQQPVSFNSEPEGAQVLVDGNLMGRTPMTVNLKKNQHKFVVIKKEGYQAQTMPLTTSFDGLTFLNILWDSSTTDLITGNAWEYSPGRYSTKLQRLGNGNSKKKTIEKESDNFIH
jgi:hypothetical protein